MKSNREAIKEYYKKLFELCGIENPEITFVEQHEIYYVPNKSIYVG